MSKDAYWFRHDSTAGRAIKMRKMSHIYGHWGKGVYWDVLEILRDQNGYQFESDQSSLQLLCDLIGCKDDSKFINWFNDCVRLQLFEIEDNMFFNRPLTENMKKWDSSKSNGSKGGRPKKNPTNNPTKTQSVTQPKPYTVEEIIEEEIILENTLDKKAFLKLFNGARKAYGHKSNIQTLNYTDESNLRLLQNYSLEDFKEALHGLLQNKWAIDNNQLMPSHFLKHDNFIKYLNTELKQEETLGQKLARQE